MSLRAKLLALFCTLAVAPLTALGIFDFFRSANAIERLLATQTAAVAGRIADQADRRLELLHGDLDLLANNEDTRHFLVTGRDSESAVRYLNRAVGAIAMPPLAVVFRDTAQRELLRITPARDLERSGAVETLPHDPPSHAFTRTLFDDAGRALGTMTATIGINQFLPVTSLDEHVGLHGYSVVVDRRARQVVSDLAGLDRGNDALGAAPTVGETAALQTVQFVEHDSARVASLAPVGSDGLAVLSAASLEEYARPLSSLRGTNLLLAILASAAMAFAFLIVSRRVTRPLEALTVATDEIARGNFGPALPAAHGTDEVGRLTVAFNRMSTQIREMLAQLESSRQMAAVGAFASQISHEIRNPLTSIKLNLQSLQRDADTAAGPVTDRRALEICMAEIQRLDGVVRGVLRLAQQPTRHPQRVAVHALLDDTLALIEPQLHGQNIAVERAWQAERDVVLGDPAELRGVVLNLIMNAVDALPAGGRVRVTTSSSVLVRSMIRLAIEDSGPGVAAGVRNAIFQPFVTTKASGNGLGLALAARDVEKHHGRLTLADHPSELGGAIFAIELPLVAGGAP